MAIRERIGEDLKAAMRARDTLRMDTIRSIKAALLLRETDMAGELSEDELIALVRGLVKQRNDAIEQYDAGGRKDLADNERREKEILETYLPAAPDAASVSKVVAEVAAELGASSMKDMGAVMKEAKARLGAAVDGKALSDAVKARLSGG
jgi:uncharacterized protein YqeY